MNYDIPLNIPAKSTYKYIFIYENEYDILLAPIYESGYYCTIIQFQKLYKMNYPHLSDEYIKKKCRIILNKLQEYNFIEIKSINKHKYFYLKMAGRTIFTKNYLSTPKVNYKNDIRNDKFLISIMRLQYYLLNKRFLTNKNMINQLYTITENIYNTVKKYELTYYNISDIELILKTSSYKEIKQIINDYEYDNILRIIWIDIYNVFKKLQLRNNTINSVPEYLKIFIVGDKIKLHYAPNIYIYDLHNINYYEKKLNALFHNFFDITSNDTKDLQKNYAMNDVLGNNYKNHIGYSLTLIGYNDLSLKNKCALLNKNINININPHNPLIKNIDYIYIDISQYLTHASLKNNSLANADLYIESNIENLLNSL